MKQCSESFKEEVEDYCENIDPNHSNLSIAWHFFQKGLDESGKSKINICYKSGVARCVECDCSLQSGMNFCPGCGQKIYWSDGND